MKVELVLKNGKRRKFAAPLAKVLISRGMGQEIPAQVYQTRDMRAATPETTSQVAVDDEKEVSALKAQADKRGIKYHHRAGAAKLRELLEV